MIYDKQINWNSHKAMAFITEPRVTKMLSFVPKDSLVADLGCYTGDIANEISRKNNRVFGADCNQCFVDMTNKLGHHSILSNFEEHIGFKNEVFDCLVAGELIEHIYHTEIFLKECNRILKYGGSIIISTPNLAYVGHRIKAVFGVAPPIMGYESGEETELNPGHVRYFTLQTLTELLQKYGFNVEKVTGSDILGNKKLGNMFPTLSYHLILRATKVKNI